MDHFKKCRPTSSKLVVATVIIGLTLNQSFAQVPGNIHIGVAGRGFNVQGNVPTAAVNELFKSGKLKFQESVLKGNVQRASHYVKPEFVDEPIKKYPPLFYATVHGETSMADMLIKNGASVKRRYNGKSIAYIAASEGYSETARFLVDQGGGNAQDISEGHALYVDNSKRQREQAKVVSAIALGVVVAMLSSSGSSSSSSSSYDQDQANFAADQRQRRYDENREAYSKGEDQPHYGVGGYW